MPAANRQIIIIIIIIIIAALHFANDEWMKSGREKCHHALSFSRGDDGRRRSFLRVVL
jgi:hypothetical protein